MNPARRVTIAVLSMSLSALAGGAAWADPYAQDPGSETQDELSSEERARLNRELRQAARSGNLDAVERLIRAGADATSLGQKTLLLQALSAPRASLVGLLIEQGADVNMRTPRSRTLLEEAATLGHVEVLEVLLESQADVTLGFPLHRAAAEGHREVVTLLLDHGVPRHTHDQTGWLPIHLAARNNDRSMVEHLIDQEFDLKALSKRGWNILQIATREGHVDLVEWLEPQGFDRGVRTREGWMLLHLSVQSRNPAMVRTFLDQRRSIRPWLPSVLHLAVKAGEVRLVQILLEDGADPEELNRRGSTALHEAVIARHPEMVRALLELDASPNARNAQDDTPLHLVARGRPGGSLEIATLLLSHGGDPNLRNAKGEPPLYLATQKRVGNEEVAVLLRDRGASATVGRPDYEARLQAIESLDPGSATIPDLARGLKDSYAKVRVAAVLGLSRAGADAAPVLVEALRDRDVSVQHKAQFALMELGTDALAPIEEGLTAEDPTLRQRLVSVLGLLVQREITEAWALSLLRHAAQDPDTRVRTAVARILKLASGSETVRDLARALSDAELTVSREAARSLASLGDAAGAARPELLEALEHDDEEVRFQSAQALAAISEKDSRVVEILRHALGKRHRRAPAIRSLSKLGPDHLGPVETALAGDWDASSTGALHGFGAAAVGLLTTLLRNSPEPGVRRAAAQTLGKLKGAAVPAVPQLGRSLTDDNAMVRTSAVSALAELGPQAKEAVPELRRAVREGDDILQAAAANALGRIGPDAAAALDDLRQALTDTNPVVQQESRRAIERISRSVIPPAFTVESFEDAAWLRSSNAGRRITDDPEHVKVGSRSLEWDLSRSRALSLRNVPKELSPEMVIAFWIHTPSRIPGSVIFLNEGQSETPDGRTQPIAFMAPLRMTSGWTRVEIPLSKFQSFGDARWDRVTEFRIQFPGRRAVTVYLDDIVLLETPP